MITGVSTINVRVKDYKKAIAFYTNQLGFKLTANEPNIDHYEVAPPNTSSPGLCFWEDSKMVGEHTGICFGTKDIRATCQMLKKNGVRVTEPYQAHGEWWAGFKDPDDNSYTLHQV